MNAAFYGIFELGIMDYDGLLSEGSSTGILLDVDEINVSTENDRVFFVRKTDREQKDGLHMWFEPHYAPADKFVEAIYKNLEDGAMSIDLCALDRTFLESAPEAGTMVPHDLDDLIPKYRRKHGGVK